MIEVNLIEKSAALFKILRHYKMSKIDWFRRLKIKINNLSMLIFSMDKVWTATNKYKTFCYGQGNFQQE